jgi:RNA polymerase sigma-70 factor (family 1)
LVQRIREGDCRAFAHMYEKYSPKLFRATYQRLRDRETAQEIVQEIFANLWLRRADLHIHRSLEHYLYRSLRYEMLNHFRALAVRARYASQYRLSVSSGDEGTQHLLSLNELNARLEIEMGRLPQKCRNVFIMSRYSGYSTREIAEALNISPRTVEVHMGNALRILRIGLQEFINVK